MGNECIWRRDPEGLWLSMGQGSPTSTHVGAKRQYRAELGDTGLGGRKER